MDYKYEDTNISKLVADQEHLHACVESLKSAVKENTEITQQIRDILTSFKVVGAVAKWLGVVAAAVTSTIAVVKVWR